VSISDPQSRPQAQPSFALPEALIGLGLLICAGLMFWQTATMRVSPLYSKVGPTVFPYMTATGLVVLAVLLFVQALRGGWQPDDEKEVWIDWMAVAFVAAGLLANVLLIQPLGFTAASVILFVLVAHGFGSRNPIRNASIGLVLSLAAYFGFAKALGVNIGAGVIERAVEVPVGYLADLVGAAANSIKTMLGA
jgi:putative tricarboxylic transport membrane protein